MWSNDKIAHDGTRAVRYIPFSFPRWDLELEKDFHISAGKTCWAQDDRTSFLLPICR